MLTAHKQTLLDVADALLVRQSLDAEQVRRLAAGLPLDEPTASPEPPPAPATPDVRARAKEWPSIVPSMPPRPVTQE